MNSRQDFLKALFRSLDANGLGYCVLRNYECLLEESGPKDIDLLVEEKDLREFREILLAAAVESGQRFVHHARYVNHSYVFWSSAGNFTRIDVDTEIRWRLFPLLSARGILARKQWHGDFFVPHPCDESAVLFSQMLWTGRLEERYRRQLAHLHTDCKQEELRRTLDAAFGSAGDHLADFQAQIASCQFGTNICVKTRHAVIRKTLCRPAEWRAFVGNAVADMQRLWERIRNPAGISLLYVTSAGTEPKLDAFLQQVEFLFPAKKCFMRSVDLSGGNPARWGIADELRRLRALFKGGLCVQFYRMAHDADIAKVIGGNSHRFYRSHCIVCRQDSSGSTRLTHAETGCHAENAKNQDLRETDLSALLISFISTVLEQRNRGDSGRKLVHSAL